MTEELLEARMAEASLSDRIEWLIESGHKVEMLRLVLAEEPVDVAEALESLPFDELVNVLRAVMISDVGFCAEIINGFGQLTLVKLARRLTQKEWAILFRELSDDEIVYILDLFPEEAQAAVVARMDQSDRADLLEQMNYPEDSAGRLMTREFVAMDVHSTVEAATEKIRQKKDIDPVNLLYVYVTEDQRLVGMVSMRQLLLNKKSTRLREIMRTDFTPIDVNMDQRLVAELVSKHDDVTVPVIDAEGRVKGIITVDDVIDVIEEESEEDLLRHIGTSEEELLAETTRRVVFLRLPWVCASFCGSFLVILVLRLTEQGIFKDSAGRIFTFVPMISAMGGNVGVQSSTIMARFLSTGSLDWREARAKAFREAKVGMSLGLICGLMIGAIALVWGGSTMLFVVMTAMIATLTMAAITGTLIPVLMKKLGQDPALATGPFVGSFNDFIAICVYFSIVYLLRAQLNIS